MIDALAWLAGAIIAGLGLWLAGKRNGAVRGENKAMREDGKAHERMNQDADLGIGATDDERRRKLLDLANRLNGD